MGNFRLGVIPFKIFFSILEFDISGILQHMENSPCILSLYTTPYCDQYVLGGKVDDLLLSTEEYYLC